MTTCNKKYYQTLLFASLIFYSLISCNTTEPPPPSGDNPTLTLELEDVSCTEAWIKLTTTNLQLPAELILIQSANGDSSSQILNLNTKDSLLYIDSLLPNQDYTFIASHSGLSGISSNELNVTTMDTTSHNFNFETFTFGGSAGSSALYDVAIIDENNVWAVGEILVADTSQNGYTMYNAVHWDGTEWKLHRIMFYTICGQQHQNAYAASSIFAFSENDIWVGMLGSQVTRLNDTGQVFIHCIPVSVRKLWGSDSQNIYAVGVNGQIAYYNGTQWTRIESGTDVNINDVFGVTDQISNQRKVFCVVSNVFNISDHKILTIDENNNVDSLHWDQDRRINSVWSDNGWIVYTSGGGVFNNKSGVWYEETSIPLYYTNRIRGNGLNDIFVAGDFGLLAHFNGIRWNVYEEFLFNVSSLSITVNGNVIAAMGRQGEKALIIIGKRN